ncbi:MAG: EamA family transporter, partial [Alphaproteobacteria bacterium]
MAEHRAEEAQARRRQRLGLALVVLSGLGYALNIVLARPVYGTGGEPLTLLLARSLFVGLALALYLGLTGRPMALPPRQRYAAWAIGVLLAAQGYGYYGSVRYIDTSLAVLIVYTYPMLVALAGWLIEREPMGPRKVAAVAAGFAGVALALEVSLGRVDGRGMGLAFLGAVGLATVVFATGRVLRNADSLRVAFHMTAANALAYAAVLAVRGAPAF